MAATIRYDFDARQWERAIAGTDRRARDLTPAHKEIGEALVGAVRRNFETEGVRGDWAPLSPATLINRARGRSGRAQVFKRRGGLTANAQRIIAGAKALIWSGRLLRSVTYRATATFVDVGSNLVQAARLWFGSAPGVRPVTPARNPLELNTDDLREVERIYVDHLGKDLR